MDYFKLVWPMQLWELIVRNTNAYANRRIARNANNNWKANSVHELPTFIGLSVHGD